MITILKKLKKKISKEFLFMFSGIRIMARTLDLGSGGTISIQRKIDKNSLFRCVYNNKTYNLLIYSYKL